jgi:hypothetical protein
VSSGGALIDLEIAIFSLFLHMVHKRQQEEAKRENREAKTKDRTECEKERQSQRDKVLISPLIWH